MRKKLLISAMVMMVAAMFVFIACGGGGGGGNGGGGGGTPTISAPPAGTLATINPGNGQGVTGSAMFGQELNNIMGVSQQIVPMSGPNTGNASSASLFNAVMNAVKAELALDGQYQADGSLTDGGDCDHGGSGSIDMTWNGPDAPVASCADASDLSGTLQIVNCGLEPGVTMNGSVTFSISGSLCQPTGMSMTFTDISYDDTQAGTSVKAGELGLSASNLTWSGDLTDNGFMTSADVMINGDATGTMDGSEYAVVFENYTQSITTPDDITYTIDISGRLFGGCLDGWATVTTLAPIEVRDTADCPHTGQIEISGDGSMTIDFHLDGSVTMGDTTYNSCNELNVGCPM